MGGPGSDLQPFIKSQVICVCRRWLRTKKQNARLQHLQPPSRACIARDGGRCSCNSKGPKRPQDPPCLGPYSQNVGSSWLCGVFEASRLCLGGGRSSQMPAFCAGRRCTSKARIPKLKCRKSHFEPLGLVSKSARGIGNLLRPPIKIFAFIGSLWL